MFRADKGQGLNNAMHDVATLARKFKEKSTNRKAEVVCDYEKEIRVRGKEAIVGSLKNSLATHDWNKRLQSPLFTAGLQQKLTPQQPDGDERVKAN